jgi:hypothetical protein
MRVLLDECLPRRLRNELVDHDVRTVPEMGWSGLKNGELLRRAEAEFDALLTIDQNLSRQQNITARRIAVVTLSASSNRLADLRPLIPAVHEALATVRPGDVVRAASDTAPAG